MSLPKIIRTSTVPTTLDTFCEGLFSELSASYDIVVVSSPGEALGRMARREGVRCRAVAMERRMALWRDLRSLWRLYRVFRSERPQMVHSMTPKAGLLSMTAAWMAKVPVRVHTFTGLVFPSAKGLLRRVLMCTDWLTCRCATHVVPEGEGVRSDLLRHGITRKPMKVLGYGNVRGIDLRYYDKTPQVMRRAADIRKELHISPSDFVFLFVGRVVRDKGVRELVEAFTQLQVSLPCVAHLVLVGREEPLLDPLDAETLKSIACSAHIHEVGEQADVRPWYAAADAFVLPSYREGFPNVVIEAGAMGLPSIVSDVNGSREIILSGRNGAIVHPQNSHTLCEAMREFVLHLEQTRRMAAEARPLVAARYEQGYVRECLKTFYKEVLEV